MPTIPKKRLLVYAAAGLLVLAVGVDRPVWPCVRPAACRRRGWSWMSPGRRPRLQSSTWPAGSAIPGPAVSTTASSTDRHRGRADLRPGGRRRTAAGRLSGAARRPGVPGRHAGRRLQRGGRPGGGALGRPVERRLQALHPAARGDHGRGRRSPRIPARQGAGARRRAGRSRSTRPPWRSSIPFPG